MRMIDLVHGASGNVLRSRARTVLTGIAVMIGSFTLVLTVGIGTGVNAYIADTVDSLGAPTTMELSRADDTEEGDLQVYDPEAGTVTGPGFSGSGPGISEEQLDQARALPGVVSVEPFETILVDHVQRAGGERYSSGLGALQHDNVLQTSVGVPPDDTSTSHEIAVPANYVGALDYSDETAILGEELIFGFRDQTGAEHTAAARVTGVIRPGVIPQTTPVANQALVSHIAQVQAVGMPSGQRRPMANAGLVFSPDLDVDDVNRLKEELRSIGLEGTTVLDRIGTFKAVIDGIVLVMAAFAAITLLAAAFGVANTLLMSVQERTREIGLLKALGTSGRVIFWLFALEAVVIGILGAVIGGGAAIALGTAANGVLTTGMLSALPGLNVYTVDPVALMFVLVLILAMTFIAGTAPAVRAALKEPIEALRYE